MRTFSNKRGQITLFVVIAILIIGGIILLYVFRTSLFKPSLSVEESQKLVSSQVQPVRDHIEGCMKTISRKTLNTMGRQGGYFIPRAERATIPLSVMPDAPIVSYALFYDSSTGYINELPSINEMKKEFSDSLEKNEEFYSCIGDFENFKKILNVENPKNVTIDRDHLDFGESSKQIVIKFSYPVKLIKGNSTTLVDNYVIKIPINLARIRELSSRIVNSITTGKNYMKVIDEENKIEWDQLKNNANSEKIIISSEAYSEVPSSLSGSTYNNKNQLFKLEYQRPALEIPFDYYLLVGLKD